MSLRSLLFAVRDKCRDVLDNAPYSFNEHEVGLGFEGRPPPETATKFLAVHPLAWEPGNIQAHKGLHEVYTIGLTLTVKYGEVPFTDLGEYQFFLEGEGMEATLRACIAGIHQNYDIVTAANVYISGSTADKHQKWLEWIGTDPEPRIEGPDWVHSAKEVAGAWVQTARLRGGDRLQRFSLQE